MFDSKYVICGTLRDASRTLACARHERMKRDVFLQYICSEHCLVHGVNDRITAIDGSFYCDAGALKLLRVTEPQLTEAEFAARLSHFQGFPRLWHYAAPAVEKPPSRPVGAKDAA
jgi:hypothetical protein